MRILTIRNVPEDLYKTIAEQAQLNRRSLQQQVMTLLDKARLISQDCPVEKAAELRQRLAHRKLGDTVREIRAERKR